MDFLICYEHKLRELDNACLLKTELEKRGYSVGIVSKETLRRWDSFFPAMKAPQLFVVPNFYKDENIKKLMNNFDGKIMAVVNLQSEQVLSKKWLDNGFHIPKGKAREALHICWSELIEKRLQINVENDKLLVTGCLPMDFTKTQFDSFFRTRTQISTEFCLDEAHKWVLFISSFTLSNFTVSQLEDIKADTANDVTDLKNCMAESKEKVMIWIEKFILQNKDYEFIYRPHPGEMKDPYLINLSQKHRNFHVISDYSVRQWIKVCDHLNTWVSTSIIDAFFMKKYCAILRPNSIPENIDSEIMLDADYITDFEEFLEINTGKATRAFPITDEMVALYYTHDSNIPVYKKICDALENIVYDKRNKYDYSFDEDIPDKISFYRKLKNSFVIILILLYQRKLLPQFKIIKYKNFRILVSEYFGVKSYIENCSELLKKLI